MAEKPPDPGSAASEPDDNPTPAKRGGVLQWVIFVEIALLCALGAYMQITGLRQLPLP